MSGLARQRAFTLIEVLVVIVLLGLIGGIAVVGIGRAVRQDPLTTTASSLQRMGTLQRRHAESTGGALLELTPRGWSALANSPTGTDLVVPDDVSCTWHDATGAPITRLLIDERGRSIDCSVAIVSGDRRATWRWLGLSGVWLRDEEATR